MVAISKFDILSLFFAVFIGFPIFILMLSLVFHPIPYIDLKGFSQYPHCFSSNNLFSTWIFCSSVLRNLVCVLNSALKYI